MKKKLLFLLPIISLTSCCVPIATSCARELDNHYLWITANTEFSIYCSFNGQTSVDFPDIQYSDDYGLTWWKISQSHPSIYFNKGRSIAFKGYNPNGLSTQQTYFGIDIESSKANDNSSAKISGRLMSLIDNGAGKSNAVPNDYCFYRLFNNDDSNNIVNEADLIFPSTLKQNCFSRMFDGCSKLNSIKVNFKDWNDSQNSFENWLLDVSSTGNFICPSELDTTQRDASHIPEGWQIKNNA